MAQYLSHYEYVERQTFWGRKRELRPVYVEEQVVVRWYLVTREQAELMRIEHETRRIELETEQLRALKRRLDAEAAMLGSHIVVAQLRAEAAALLPAPSDAPKAIAYNPAVPIKLSR